MKLFKVRIEPVDWDQYDGAVIACESREKLEGLLNDHFFNSLKDGFSMDFDQHVSEIAQIGYTEVDFEEEAKVILGSFNAG